LWNIIVVSGVCVKLIPKIPARFKPDEYPSADVAVDKATSDDEHAVSIDIDGPVNAKTKDNLPEATLSADPEAENGVIRLLY